MFKINDYVCVFTIIIVYFGYYKYMIRKIGPFKIHANIEYVRWGQSWMFLALSKALLVINQSKD